jgi:hypothetical protein
VKSLVQLGQARRVPANRPRTPRQHVQHRRALDALHDELEPAGADVFDARCRIAMRRDVLHHLRLALHRPAAP